MIPSYLRHSVQPARERIVDYIAFVSADGNHALLSRVFAVVAPHLRIEGWDVGQFATLCRALGFTISVIRGRLHIVLDGVLA